MAGEDALTLGISEGWQPFRPAGSAWVSRASSRISPSTQWMVRWCSAQIPFFPARVASPRWPPGTVTWTLAGRTSELVERKSAFVRDDGLSASGEPGLHDMLVGNSRIEAEAVPATTRWCALIPSAANEVVKETPDTGCVRLGRRKISPWWVVDSKRFHARMPHPLI
jgi:hypothetical protein